MSCESSTVASPADSSGSTEAMETSPPAAATPSSQEPIQSSASDTLMDTDGTGITQILCFCKYGLRINLFCISL